MLVLSRKVGQKIVLGDQVTITINRISGQRVSIGIVAPPGIRIIRAELDTEPPPAAPRAPHPEVGFSDPNHAGPTTTGSDMMHTPLL